MSDQACETPMSDHVADFWKLIETEHVRILVDIRRDHDEGQPPHWDSSSFSNDVAKALVAHRSVGRSVVYLRDVGDHEDECWIPCAKGDPGAVEFTAVKKYWRER